MPIARLLAALFGVEAPGILKHLNNIFATQELQREATISKLETVQNDGERTVRRLIDFYNLDAILAVGYRGNSREATQFRIRRLDMTRLVDWGLVYQRSALMHLSC